MVFTHISARAAGGAGFLINPYGMLFDEITASSLVRVDAAGNKVSESPHPVNPAGFVIHSAIHAARHDAVRAAHAHGRGRRGVGAARGTVANLATGDGSRWRRLATTTTRASRSATTRSRACSRDLGDNNVPHSAQPRALTVGPTVADAFLSMYILQRACEVQLLAQSGGRVLVSVDPRIVGGVKENVIAVTRGLGGSLAWPGLLRKLDRLLPGYAE